MASHRQNHLPTYHWNTGNIVWMEWNFLTIFFSVYLFSVFPLLNPHQAFTSYYARFVHITFFLHIKRPSRVLLLCIFFIQPIPLLWFHGITNLITFPYNRHIIARCEILENLFKWTRKKSCAFHICILMRFSLSLSFSSTGLLAFVCVCVYLFSSVWLSFSHIVTPIEVQVLRIIHTAVVCSLNVW